MRQFRRIAEFIEGHTGIRMPETKVHLIESRLVKRIRAAGFSSIDAYCDHILSIGVDDEDVTAFINAVTTNKTDFFRESSHFDYLARAILPALRAEGRSLVRCWSAAASTGMEAYTLAMVLADFMDGTDGQDFSILATDIDTAVLQEAWRGIYSLAALKPVPPALRARYVASARDRSRKEARIVPALRRKVTFARLNLMDSHYPVGDPMDVIFCRNVLIYFEKETQAGVIARLCDNLRPGGHLILGHSESISGLNVPLVPVSNTVFRKKG
ncbi:chemotaxis methyltransferase [Novosphingobium nitrogenifigens DSM 19370]|uniref:Chemotaxis protein methyltransferase n=1 Tax=Novosphingobium nitrogenifigens DSM 19370 TaxID=983920 RepID=F1Z3U1_9SPHN|nr:protein-glutamate O-methyltransferase CheR [Novosphingobium nitrogenifigens]EGD60735.1 chemotaxis methyltransferase [Novosphingobium nitrogenifigens DSM 19370]